MVLREKKNLYFFYKGPPFWFFLGQTLKNINSKNKMDITYLVKQNGTVQVIAENYKYSRTSHAAHKDRTLEYKCCVP